MFLSPSLSHKTIRSFGEDARCFASELLNSCYSSPGFGGSFLRKSGSVMRRDQSNSTSAATASAAAALELVGSISPGGTGMMQWA